MIARTRLGTALLLLLSTAIVAVTSREAFALIMGGEGNSPIADAKNQIAYENVPPGRYVLRGQPNPSSGNERTKAITIDLKGGQTAKVTLSAK
jgi:hypothetical protein